MIVRLCKLPTKPAETPSDFGTRRSEHLSIVYFRLSRVAEENLKNGAESLLEYLLEYFSSFLL